LIIILLKEKIKFRFFSN